jgi:hypothetical protein
MTARLRSWEIYTKNLSRCTNQQGGSCVDSAFSNHKKDYLLKLGQDLLGLSALTRREQQIEHQLRRQTMSARQTAEWGMLSIQASFPRVKDRFIFEERGERRIVMKMFVLLYNMRARMVGINQIQNTYIVYDFFTHNLAKFVTPAL